jgi:hypothetical protein
MQSFWFGLGFWARDHWFSLDQFDRLVAQEGRISGLGSCSQSSFEVVNEGRPVDRKTHHRAVGGDRAIILSFRDKLLAIIGKGIAAPHGQIPRFQRPHHFREDADLEGLPTHAGGPGRNRPHVGEQPPPTIWYPMQFDQRCALSLTALENTRLRGRQPVSGSCFIGKQKPYCVLQSIIAGRGVKIQGSQEPEERGTMAAVAGPEEWEVAVGGGCNVGITLGKNGFALCAQHPINGRKSLDSAAIGAVGHDNITQCRNECIGLLGMLIAIGLQCGPRGCVDAAHLFDEHLRQVIANSRTLNHHERNSESGLFQRL